MMIKTKETFNCGFSCTLAELHYIWKTRLALHQQDSYEITELTGPVDYTQLLNQPLLIYDCSFMTAVAMTSNM